MSDDYKRAYEYRWIIDTDFSEQLKPKIIDIIKQIPLPRNVQDNIGTEDDKRKGYDLTINPLPTQVAVRIRRNKYKNYDEFTEDDKERDTMKPDVYFFCYATLDENDIESLLYFNHRDFRKAREKKLFTETRKQNSKHSKVWFTGYPLSEINKYCATYARKGKIAWKILKK